jgi:hypothetical protein
VGSVVYDDSVLRAEKMSPTGRLAASHLDRLRALLLLTLSTLRLDRHSDRPRAALK